MPSLPLILRPCLVFCAMILLEWPVNGRADDVLQRYAFEKAAMGLPFRIVLYAPSQDVASDAAEAAFARIAELNAVLSDYDSDSELSRLSRTSGEGEAVPVSGDLWKVLSRCQEMAKRTHGAFDITVGPLTNLWRRARRKQELPSPEAIAEMKARVGYGNLRLNWEGRTAELLLPEMRLDAGAVGKSYAVDEALAVLERRGIRQALVAGSGDMAAGDAPPDQPGWKIEVAPLDAPDAPPPQIIFLKNQAIATSGDVFQRVEIAGKRYSHIINPKTGYGVTDHCLASVVAPDCATANSYSTTINVLGPERGLQLVEEDPHVAARVVRKPGAEIEAVESSRWKELPRMK